MKFLSKHVDHCPQRRITSGHIYWCRHKTKHLIWNSSKYYNGTSQIISTTIDTLKKTNHDNYTTEVLRKQNEYYNYQKAHLKREFACGWTKSIIDTNTQRFKAIAMYVEKFFSVRWCTCIILRNRGYLCLLTMAYRVLDKCSSGKKYTTT